MAPAGPRPLRLALDDVDEGLGITDLPEGEIVGTIVLNNVHGGTVVRGEVVGSREGFAEAVAQRLAMGMLRRSARMNHSIDFSLRYSLGGVYTPHSPTSRKSSSVSL